MSLITKYFVSVCAVVFVSLVFSVSVAQAGVVHDASSSATTGSATAQTLSWLHTVSGLERVLVVGVSLNTNTLVSSVTYGGQSLTKITAYESGNNARVSLWYLLNPPTGINTVTVRTSAVARFVAGAHSYVGVNQQIPIGTPVTARGSGTSASLSVPSATGDVVVDVLSRRGDLTTNPITAGSGQTVRWNARTTINNANSGVTGGGSSKTGIASTLVSWAWPASRAWSMAGISLRQSVPPADTTPPLRFNALPTDVLPSGTVQTTLSLQTNENATCRYSTTPGTLYSQMVSIFSGAGTTSHGALVTNLTDGNSYSYFVRCVDTVGNQNTDDAQISFSIFSPPPPPRDEEAPSVPENIVAIAPTYSSVDLSWSPSADNVAVTGYKVYRNGMLVSSVSENSFQDQNLTESTVYSYEVLAFDAEGNESQKSQPTIVTTPAIPEVPDIEAPSVPENVSASALSTSEVDVSWDGSTDNVGVAGYRVYRDGVLVSVVLSNVYHDNGLAYGTAYEYSVSAIDASNNESPRSSASSASTHTAPPPPDTIAPVLYNALPSGVLPYGTVLTELSLLTDENAVCRYDSQADTSFSTMQNLFSTTGSLFHSSSISGLIESTDYNFYVRCQDESGNDNSEDYLIQFSVEPFVDTTPPSIPSNFRVATVTPTQISIAWDESTDDTGVSGYKVFRDGFLVATTYITEFTDFGLEQSSHYNYTISAYDNAHNESLLSDALSVTTSQEDNIPPILSDVSASDITTTSAVISWQTDEEATSRVEYGLTSLYGAEVFNGDTSTNHSIILTGLSAGSTYHFRVRSIDGSGNASISVDYTFSTIFAPDTTPPAPIQNLSITESVGQTFLGLQWTASGDDGSLGQALSYEIRYSTSTITESNWNLATPVTGAPTPALAGVIQHYLAVGLTPATTYYFAIRSIDEVGNVSALSNIVLRATLSRVIVTEGGANRSVQDVTPPNTPTEFQIISTGSQNILRWKNPDDVDFVRVVVVRKEGSAPHSIGDGVVVYEGDHEEIIDTDISGLLTYFYSIFAYDRVPNYSQPASSGSVLREGVTQIDFVSSESIENKESSVSSNEVATYQPTLGFLFSRALFFGLKGEDVRELQKILALNSAWYPQGIISGYFGTLTRNAVRKFQCAYSIICSGNETATGYGRVGPKTILQLNNILNGQQIIIPQLTPRLSFGVTSTDVTALQQFLAKDVSVYPEGSVTGYFGTLTRNAVRKFQCLHNIVCAGDESSTGYGTVGPKTWTKIQEIQ